MRGIVFNAPRDVRVESVDDPAILEPTDALVRVTKAGICGSDMHIYNHGDAFGISPGCRLGHEFVGVVEAVGAEVRTVRAGQKVASPFWISCGGCRFCDQRLFTSCVAGGAFGYQPFWPGGGEVQGAQSQYVRVPMADGTLEAVPESLAHDSQDLRVLPLTDVFATAYHAVVGAEVEEGDTVLVIGDGAVGLLACHAAQLRAPKAVVLAGHHEDRLAVGRRLGATHAVNTRADDDLGAVLAGLTEGAGPEAVVDAVASADSMSVAANALQPGGTLSWVGMEVFLGAPQLPWDVCYLRNLTIRGGVAPVKRYLPELWPLLEQGRIDPSLVFTHDLAMEEAARGYSMMANRDEGTIKVAVSPAA
jgi:alcohol dehydrogenase